MTSRFEQEKMAYLESIRKLIVFTGRDAKRYLRDLSMRLNEFVDETGAADFSAVRAHFGAPEEIAQSFLEQANPEKVRKRTRLGRVILIAVFLMLLIIGVFYGLTRINIWLHPTHGVEEIFEPPEGYLENKVTTGKTV